MSKIIISLLVLVTRSKRKRNFVVWPDVTFVPRVGDGKQLRFALSF